MLSLLVPDGGSGPTGTYITVLRDTPCAVSRRLEALAPTSNIKPPPRHAATKTAAVAAAAAAARRDLQFSPRSPKKIDIKCIVNS